MQDRKKKFWKKGGGEVVGFLCIVPCVIFILAVLVTIIQLGSIKERLEYTAYKACRQIIVCRDADKDGDYLDDAKKIAKQIAREDLEYSTEVFEPGTVKAKVTLVENPDDTNGTEVKWEKGRYVQCTVSVKVKTPIKLMNGRKSSSIVMMIESPANEGGDYPWFKDL